ncbi:hypothetical protein AB8810_09425 [Xanthomonas sp. NCPPB 3005]|uniref:hypothetical protein n=1 Tax=Xanthomonas sp. NCPPB 3005 TaxID=3240913 RepID=UPI003512267A
MKPRRKIAIRIFCLALFVVLIVVIFLNGMNNGNVDVVIPAGAYEVVSQAKSRDFVGEKNWEAPEAKSFSTATFAVKALARHADAGHGLAACELASIYIYCASLDQEGARVQQLTLQARDDTDLSIVSKLESSWKKKADYCLGLPPASTAKIIDYLRVSADSGNSYAQNLYLSGVLFSGDTLGSINQLVAYRNGAEGLALQAVGQGNVDVMLQLGDAYSGRPRASKALLYEAVRPNPARALALFQNALLRIDAGARGEPLRIAIGGRIKALNASYPGLVADNKFIPNLNNLDLSVMHSSYARLYDPKGKSLGECRH